MNFEIELDLLKKDNNLRSIKNIDSKDGKYIYLNGRKLLNLSSNNYLNIGNNKELEKEFFENSYKKEAFSSSSSRLLTGNETIYFELEKSLSKLYNKEKSLIFNSGYSANLGIIQGLFNKNDVIFCDKLNHASIIDGIRLSEAKMIRYNHLDYNHLEKLLNKERNNFKNVCIISESLFSMDGDLADINKLIELKKQYNCLLMIDESHSFGIYGKNGLGCCESTKDNIDIIMSGFGKGCGSFGAFCTGNNEIIEYLINKARSFIFSTSLPPINIAWTNFIINNIFPIYKEKRDNLLKLSKYFKEQLENIGFTNNSESYIIPIILNNEETLINKQKYLMENGFYVLPIRYPTVPKNSPRFRLSLTSDINKEDISNFIQILKKIK